MQWKSWKLAAIGFEAIAAVMVVQNATLVSVPNAYTHLLPDGFVGSINDTFANGTHVLGNSTVDKTLERANKAAFISFDKEFASIVGQDPEVKLVEQRKDDLFAAELGVWVPELKEVWFTSAIFQSNPFVYRFHLETNKVTKLNASDPVVNPNGGYYFDGKVYIGTFPSNETYRGGVVSVDVKTMKVEPVVNSYFGLHFNGVNDIAWAKRGHDKYMYFSDLDISPLAYKNAPTPQLPSSVWRWDPQTDTLLPVISRNEINPNGVRVSTDMETLYVTDSNPLNRDFSRYAPPAGPASQSWLGPHIYAYDFNDDMMPVNRRLFGLAGRFIADGIHCDDKGRVWTGEGDGIMVRDSKGKVIGIFNGRYFLDPAVPDNFTIANFAIAGDLLVVLAGNRLWTVKLAEVLVSENSTIVN